MKFHRNTYSFLSSIVLLCLCSCHEHGKQGSTKGIDTISTAKTAKKAPEIKNENTSGQKLLSLVFVRTDNIKNTTESQVLIFGEYCNGKYSVIDDTNNSVPSKRDSVLQKNKNWTLYFQSNPLCSLTVTKIDSAQYDCTPLMVGISKEKIDTTKLIERQHEYIQGSEGYSKGKEVNYSQTTFFATNEMEATTQIMKTPTDSLLKNPALSGLGTVLKRIYKSRDTMVYLNLYKNVVTPFTINEEQYYLSTSDCSDTIKQMLASMLCIFKIKNNTIDTVATMYKGLAIDSWGNGYNIIDMEDIDGDGIPELIMLEEGYEDSAVVIINLKDLKFNIVFNRDLFGC